MTNYKNSELKATAKRLGDNALQFSEHKKQIQYVRDFISRALYFNQLERTIILREAERHIQRVRYSDE